MCKISPISMINQVANSLIIHSFIRLLFWFLLLCDKLSPDLVAWHHSHFIISHRLCVRNLDSASGMSGLCSTWRRRSWSLWAGSFTDVSHCSAGVSGAAWLRLEGCGLFLLVNWVFYSPPCSIRTPLSMELLHMACPLSLSLWSFKLGNLIFLHALLRRQTWNHQAIFCVNLNRTILSRRH